MFHHVKELQFNARVSRPDPRFSRLLLEQFGGANEEVKGTEQTKKKVQKANNALSERYKRVVGEATISKDSESWSDDRKKKKSSGKR